MGNIREVIEPNPTANKTTNKPYDLAYELKN